MSVGRKVSPALHRLPPPPHFFLGSPPEPPAFACFCADVAPLARGALFVAQNVDNGRVSPYICNFVMGGGGHSPKASSQLLRPCHLSRLQGSGEDVLHLLRLLCMHVVPTASHLHPLCAPKVLLHGVPVDGGAVVGLGPRNEQGCATRVEGRREGGGDATAMTLQVGGMGGGGSACCAHRSATQNHLETGTRGPGVEVGTPSAAPPTTATLGH